MQLLLLGFLQAVQLVWLSLLLLVLAQLLLLLQPMVVTALRALCVLPTVSAPARIHLQPETVLSVAFELLG